MISMQAMTIWEANRFCKLRFWVSPQNRSKCQMAARKMFPRTEQIPIEAQIQWLYWWYSSCSSTSSLLVILKNLHNLQEVCGEPSIFVEGIYFTVYKRQVNTKERGDWMNLQAIVLMSGVQCLSQAYFEEISKILHAENAYQLEKTQGFCWRKNLSKFEFLAKEIKYKSLFCIGNKVLGAQFYPYYIF